MSSTACALQIVRVDNVADGSGRTNYHQFLNRQFWFMANGWYNGARTAVDGNVQVSVRSGVGSWTFDPTYLSTTITARDSHMKQFIDWYCVQAKTAPHAYGLAVP